MANEEHVRYGEEPTNHPVAVRARPSIDGPLRKLTTGLIKTYKLINEKYYQSKEERRAQERSEREKYDYKVKIDDVLGGTYKVVSPLGKGSFGQVVSCVNDKGEKFAVKVIKKKRAFTEQAKVEVKLLQNLNSRDASDQWCVVRFIESFEHEGHTCLVFEHLSMNMFELIKKTEFKGVSLSLTQKFARQLLKTLAFLCMPNISVVHCDLKPENILLRDPTRSSIKVIDFGSSCRIDHRPYTYIQSRFYRSPEVILGLQYGYPIDMWSLGCILYEIHTGSPLFSGRDEYDQMHRFVALKGMPPVQMLRRGQNTHKFFSVRHASDRDLRRCRWRMYCRMLRRSKVCAAAILDAIESQDDGSSAEKPNSESRAIVPWPGVKLTEHIGDRIHGNAAGMVAGGGVEIEAVSPPPSNDNDGSADDLVSLPGTSRSLYVLESAHLQNVTPGARDPSMGAVGENGAVVPVNESQSQSFNPEQIVDASEDFGSDPADLLLWGMCEEEIRMCLDLVFLRDPIPRLRLPSEDPAEAAGAAGREVEVVDEDELEEEDVVDSLLSHESVGLSCDDIASKTSSTSALPKPAQGSSLQIEGLNELLDFEQSVEVQLCTSGDPLWPDTIVYAAAVAVSKGYSAHLKGRAKTDASDNSVPQEADTEMGSQGDAADVSSDPGGIEAEPGVESIDRWVQRVTSARLNLGEPSTLDILTGNKTSTSALVSLFEQLGGQEKVVARVEWLVRRIRVLRRFLRRYLQEECGPRYVLRERPKKYRRESPVTTSLAASLLNVSRQTRGGSESEYGLFIDLISRMTEYNPDARIKPVEALNHPFIRLYRSSNTQSQPRQAPSSTDEPDPANRGPQSGPSRYNAGNQPKNPGPSQGQSDAPKQGGRNSSHGSEPRDDIDTNAFGDKIPSRTGRRPLNTQFLEPGLNSELLRTQELELVKISGAGDQGRAARQRASQTQPLTASAAYMAGSHVGAQGGGGGQARGLPPHQSAGGEPFSGSAQVLPMPSVAPTQVALPNSLPGDTSGLVMNYAPQGGYTASAQQTSQQFLPNPQPGLLMAAGRPAAPAPLDLPSSQHRLPGLTTAMSLQSPRYQAAASVSELPSSVVPETPGFVISGAAGAQYSLDSPGQHALVQGPLTGMRDSFWSQTQQQQLQGRPHGQVMSMPHGVPPSAATLALQPQSLAQSQPVYGGTSNPQLLAGQGYTAVAMSQPGASLGMQPQRTPSGQLLLPVGSVDPTAAASLGHAAFGVHHTTVTSGPTTLGEILSAGRPAGFGLGVSWPLVSSAGQATYLQPGVPMEAPTSLPTTVVMASHPQYTAPQLSIPMQTSAPRPGMDPVTGLPMSSLLRGVSSESYPVAHGQGTPGTPLDEMAGIRGMPQKRRAPDTSDGSSKRHELAAPSIPTTSWNPDPASLYPSQALMASAALGSTLPTLSALSSASYAAVPLQTHPPQALAIPSSTHVVSKEAYYPMLGTSGAGVPVLARPETGAFPPSSVPHHTRLDYVSGVGNPQAAPISVAYTERKGVPPGQDAVQQTPAFVMQPDGSFLTARHFPLNDLG